MRRAHVSLIVMLIISLALFAVGCAKKTVDKSEEVKPPVQQEVKVEQPAPPVPAAPEKPKEEAKIETPAPVPSLEDEMKAFEDKNIYFDFDKYSLQSEAKDVLKQKAEFLRTHSNITIQTEGHCDERGTTEYNLALGERRAKVAQDYMVSLGVAKERISTISYGKEKPVDPGHNEEAWSKNRRDHFVIVNK